MLMTVMRYNACQQHGEDGEPFNLLMPSGINDTIVLLETNVTDMTWCKCNKFIFRKITTTQWRLHVEYIFENLEQCWIKGCFGGFF